MVDPGNFVVEKNFVNVFDKYSEYFYNIIEGKWRFLLHENDREFFVHDLVTEFYKSFRYEDVDREAGTILLHWRGREYIITLPMISEVTGIEIQEGNQRSMSVEEYLPWMGPNCHIPADGGIKGRTMYRNVYATCRWIASNVVGSSHTSSFYEETLHIVHMMMTGDDRFCMVRQLFDTITFVRTRRHVIYKLPVLVTFLCRQFMPENEFLPYILQGRSTLIARAPVSSAYEATDKDDWTPQRWAEDTVFPEEEELSDNTFFRQPSPTEPREQTHRTWSGLRRLWKAVTKIDKVLDKISEALSCRATDDVDFRPRRTRARAEAEAGPSQPPPPEPARRSTSGMPQDETPTGGVRRIRTVHRLTRSQTMHARGSDGASTSRRDQDF